HCRELLQPAGSEPHDDGTAVFGRSLADNQLLRYQPVDYPGDIAVGHHQEARQFGHCHAVGLPLERGHDIELRQGHIELDTQPLAHFRFDRPRGTQNTDPQPQPLLAQGRRCLTRFCSGGDCHAPPPAMTMASPLTASAAGEHSQTTFSATSLGEIRRPPALSRARAFFTSLIQRPVLPAIAAADVSRRGVSVYPGHTAFTVIPGTLNSAASARASPTTPCLAAQYAAT